MRTPIKVCMFPLPDGVMFIEESDMDKWERLQNPKCVKDYGLSVQLFMDDGVSNKPDPLDK